jgi:hypothetical protein
MQQKEIERRVDITPDEREELAHRHPAQERRVTLIEPELPHRQVTQFEEGRNQEADSECGRNSRRTPALGRRGQGKRTGVGTSLITLVPSPTWLKLFGPQHKGRPGTPTSPQPTSPPD